MPTTRPRRTGTLFVLAGAAAALVFAGAAAWAGLSSSPLTPPVRLEGTSVPGVSPYTRPMGTDQAGLIPPAGLSGDQAGDAENLYARPGAAPACDAAGLSAALKTDAARAQAWSGVLGRPDATGLVPVLLRSDLAVVEHTFARGADVANPVVLQAGTAILVDAHGEPTVKCQNGNPLRRGTVPDRAGGFLGDPWSFFAPTNVVTVSPAEAARPTLTVLDLTTGNPATVPTAG
ncbi:hypothetical protein GCM10009836_40740 [Pseudonocardia ailaonensis]|uniref:DUF6777 domain-containing protein n=1 Tax=Pseudonocardia ailaonensis TaxID=367279 RepID=A0ABN2N7J8_9PSEU